MNEAIGLASTNFFTGLDFHLRVEARDRIFLKMFHLTPDYFFVKSDE